MVLVKRGKIFHLFILRKIEHENVIDDILDRKKAFLDYGTSSKKILKIGIFQNG